MIHIHACFAAGKNSPNLGTALKRFPVEEGILRDFVKANPRYSLRRYRGAEWRSVQCRGYPPLLKVFDSRGLFPKTAKERHPLQHPRTQEAWRKEIFKMCFQDF